MLVSLVYFFFGVQVHDLPPRLFSKAVARQLENFAGLFKEYNTKQVSGGYTSYLQMRVRIDIRTPLKCRKKIQSSYGNSMDSFYHIRLTREVNKSDMEWDLSLWEVGIGILWVPLPTSTLGPINSILGINLEGAISSEKESSMGTLCHDLKVWATGLRGVRVEDTEFAQTGHGSKHGG
ncbi:hypothetical protein Goklo_012322 [Gossypium klotzschianum]|uniref:DUF4283 domain-containing protein n=1 Tax=Gossypium klotzschianum TaxID=34286 RepID=A0A7J8VCX2_9ROSI|nr:hypothetical protein [Gossypium klotzschianum]